jgi:hypothetical protein
MCHYSHAIRLVQDSPGSFVLDGHEVYVDTASSKKGLGHEQSAHAYFVGGPEAAASGGEWHLRRWRRRWRVKGDRPRTIPLRECAARVVARDLTTSSGTVVAVVTAAELALRTLGDLRPDEFLSAPALEEFTTILAARQSVSTIYNTLEMAKQVGFLREADVDPLSNRFLGNPQEWAEKNIDLRKFVLLNDDSFELRRQAVDKWLATERPVIARVDPRKLLDLDSRKPLDLHKVDIRDTTHHAVVIIDGDERDFIVRSGWRHPHTLRMPADAATEAWGLLFSGEDELDGHL